MSKEQKVTGNIQPPNKDLELLKQKFPNCFDKNGEFDFEKFKTQLSKNEINFSKESYGMDWLGKSYARLLATDETTTLLQEDEKFNQKEENSTSENLLIKGDNLEVLKHLSNAYYEKIKMIYIDPPYNTGSDGFVYADDRKFTIEELQELAGVNEERAKRILDFTQSKSNSHSAWLTFMYPRLYIAKQLLKDDGVIFVSIDDNEVAQLRLLMDEVFGEENLLFEMIINRPSEIASNYIISKHEYVISYRKTEILNLKFPPKYTTSRGTVGNADQTMPIIEFPAGLECKNLEDGIYEKTRQKPNSAENIENFDKIIVKDGLLNEPIKLKAKWRSSNDMRNFFANECKLTKAKISGFIEEIYFKDNTFNPQIKKLTYEKLPSLFLGNKRGSKRLEDLDMSNLFDNPKSIELLNNFVRLLDKGDIILDFFAGSGTTGDAVMQLNAEDGGNRKFILIQLPELIDPKNNKTAYDFVQHELKVETPTIFDITKERLIRASKKIQEENGALSDAERKDLSNQDLGFKAFETMPIWEDYNFESVELEKQTSLFDESKLTKEDIKALLVTWKTYDGVPLTTSIQEIDLNGYTAHYSNEKLYLMDKGFSTNHLKALLEKIDSDKSFNPTTIIAFGYHFESKSLRELSENMKSYGNKKSIDIDFITRY